MTPEALLRDLHMTDWMANCTEAAFKLCHYLLKIDVEATLVHGFLSDMRHAWVEVNDGDTTFVYDLTQPRVQKCEREWYYEKMNVRQAFFYSQQEALLMAIEHEHYGWWHDEDDFNEEAQGLADRFDLTPKL